MELMCADDVPKQTKSLGFLHLFLQGFFRTGGRGEYHFFFLLKRTQSGVKLHCAHFMQT